MYRPRFLDIDASRPSGNGHGGSSPRPQANVLWFHHAGGTAATLGRRYRGASRGEVPVALWAAAMPYRDGGGDDDFDGDLGSLADAFADAVIDQRLDDLPLVVIGHSFGTTLGYEVTRRLVNRGRSPHRLVVLSFPPPDRLSHRTPLHSLSDAELIAQVDRQFGGIPAGLLQDQAAMALFVKPLRRDLAWLETYRMAPEAAPLPVPIVAIAGIDDRAVTMAAMMGWSIATSRPLRLRSQPGGHFFPLDRPGEIIRAAVWDVAIGPAPAAVQA